MHPPRRDIERYVPGMVDPGCEQQADLADDLRPQMKTCNRIRPLSEIEFGPVGTAGTIYLVHGVILLLL